MKKRVSNKLAFEYYESLGTARTHRQVAERFNVSLRTIQRLAKGDHWKEKIQNKIEKSTDQNYMTISCHMTKEGKIEGKIQSKPGRKEKISYAIINELAGIIEKGVTNESACYYIGIAPRTFYNWMSKGKADEAEGMETLYTAFLHTIKKAEVGAEIKCLENIHKATETHWQAGAWYLERKYPDDWGRKIIKEIPYCVNCKAVVPAERKIDPEKNSAVILANLKDPEKQKAHNEILILMSKQETDRKRMDELIKIAGLDEEQDIYKDE